MSDRRNLYGTTLLQIYYSSMLGKAIVLLVKMYVALLRYSFRAAVRLWTYLQSNESILPEFESGEGAESTTPTGPDEPGSGSRAIRLLASSTTIDVNEEVTVTVRDDRGQPVPGVEILTPDYASMTNERGECAVDFADTGTHDVKARLNGTTRDTVSILVSKPDDTTTDEQDGGPSDTATHRRDDGSADGGANEQDPAADRTERLVVIPSDTVVDPTQPVDLVVRNENGARVEGATVEYRDDTVRTDDRGACTISFREPGVYEVTATDPDSEASSASDGTEITVAE